MELLVKACWILLAAAHAPPAAVALAPRLVSKLYGVSGAGDLGVLLTHRGVLFLAIVLVCVSAVFDVGGRRIAGVAAAISMVGFLILYARAGFPAGPLRRIALVDAAALAPLAVVLVDAWRPRV